MENGPKSIETLFFQTSEDMSTRAKVRRHLMYDYFVHKDSTTSQFYLDKLERMSDETLEQLYDKLFQFKGFQEWVKFLHQQLDQQDE